MKKQLIGISVVALSSLFLAACGQQTAKSGNHTIYDVKTTKVTTKDDEWIIRGTTDAPDGTKIVAVPSNSVGDDLNGSEKTGYDSGFPKVKDGKFRLQLSIMDASESSSYKVGKKDKVAIFAVTNYTKKYDDEVSGDLIDAFNDKFDPTTLKITSGQSKYMKSLDDDSSDDASSDTSSDTIDDSSSSESSETSSAADSSSDSVTAQDQAALESAETYATMSMSKQGIYEQLISSSGDGFTATEAQYAVDHLTDVDWNENALESAQTYQDDMSMSLADIRDQLTSSAGDQFTPAQADYAINHLNQ